MQSTPLYQLSESACQSLLPSGLTTDLPLLELVKQQAQLLIRLRGKQGCKTQAHEDQGSCPVIQPLSFHVYTECPTAAPHIHHDDDLWSPMRVPQVPFGAIAWSPCARLEDDSEWVILEPKGCSDAKPVVVNALSGQRVSFSGDGSQALMGTPIYGKYSILSGICLQDGQRILFHPFGAPYHYHDEPCSICLADARSASVYKLQIPGAQHPGELYMFTVGSHSGQAKSIACWASSPCSLSASRKWDEPQVSTYDLSNDSPLYQLSCPHHLLSSFLECHRIPAPSRQQAGHEHVSSKPSRRKDWDLTASHLALDTSGTLLAIVWDFRLVHEDLGCLVYDTALTGMSVHTAMSGQLVHSMVMTPMQPGFLDCQLSWLPGSSTLLYTTSDGAMHLMTSSGCTLWSIPQMKRCPDFILDLASQNEMYDVVTELSASPCGRWIVSADRVEHGRSKWGPRGYTGQICLIQALTGSILHQHICRRGLSSMSMAWSKSGEICLLDKLRLVLSVISGPGLSHTIVHQYKLSGGPFYPDDIFSDARFPGEYCQYLDKFRSTQLSLSPCGRAVVGKQRYGYGHAARACILHWQLPAPSAATSSTSAAPAASTAASNSQHPAAFAANSWLVAAQAAQTTSAPTAASGVAVEPSICAALNDRELNFKQLAWHPLPGACMYAIADFRGGVFCIDARRNRCVHTWGEAHLHGLAAMLEAAPRLQVPPVERHRGAPVTRHRDEHIDHVLKWSHNGTKLAVVSKSYCSVVHF